MPIAKELGIDGVNYSIFRYEKGNANLNPEESYQLDAAAVYSHDGIKASVTPFFNYFPNYIYLCPTSEYKEGLQLYNYEQSRVARCGFEAELSFLILQHFKISAGGEYLYARQLSGDKKAILCHSPLHGQSVSNSATTCLLQTMPRADLQLWNM